MTEKNILWLYDDLLDLYGDSGNLTILVSKLRAMGIEARITCKSLGDTLDFDSFDLIYAGPGKAKNLAQAALHLQKYAAQVKAAVAAGKLFFVTGNARLLFGKGFTGFDGKEYPGVGLLPYTGRETGNVFVSDVVYARQGAEGYGFINRTAHIDGNEEGFLFDVLQGACDSETPTGHEGNRLENFFGTWLLGPVLVKNPALLKEVLQLLAGAAYTEPDTALEQTALDATVAELPH